MVSQAPRRGETLGDRPHSAGFQSLPHSLKCFLRGVARSVWKISLQSCFGALHILNRSPWLLAPTGSLVTAETSLPAISVNLGRGWGHYVKGAAIWKGANQDGVFKAMTCYVILTSATYTAKDKEQACADRQGEMKRVRVWWWFFDRELGDKLLWGSSHFTHICTV